MPDLRTVNGNDREELRSLLDGIFRTPKRVFDQSQLTDFPLVFRESNFGNSRVIVEDGRIVSHAALWPRRVQFEGREISTGILVSVATLPQYRRRGYAAQLVCDLMRTMHQEGLAFCTLWTSVTEFYADLGWEAVQPRGLLATVDGSSFSNTDTGGFLVRKFDPESDFDAVLALQVDSPLRLSRTPEEAGALLSLPKVPVFVACRNGRVEAWLAHGCAVNKQGLIDYGGSLEGIVRLARHVLEQEQGLGPQPWPVLPGRPDLIQWVRENGIPSVPLPASKGAGTEMVYVIDRDRFSEDLRAAWFVWGLDWA